MVQFRTKARAVELLGKGQIADLPTAISELWKNGYDAYAGHLSCNLYLPGYRDNQSPLFTLCDDGFGMSAEDILNKWIVLGTDSKARGKLFLTDKERFYKPMRIPMGEKGIGRLSVSYLGSPMLMLTKKENKKCQALFIDWRILENYNLFVDDINIPLGEFSNPDEFRLLVPEMLAEFQKNFDKSQWQDQTEQMEVMQEDINNLFIPDFINKEIVSDFFSTEYHGTTFLIFKPNEQLLELADNYKNIDDESDAITEIRRSLSGIYNVFLEDPDFTTVFNIYDSGGRYNIINDFFEHKDFDNTDHYIKGSFDENGFFTGTVRVFKESYPYTFKPVRIPGKTPYGPMGIELGILEGKSTNSSLSSEAYHSISDKTDKFGGLYIYRDKFRVLPYGRVDYDFLKFEERRTKSAGYYFFSHRNMFGYITISREQNKNLTDKAGREGFIENKAYREFKKDLIRFFIDLSLTFFKSQNEENQEEKNARSEQLKDIQEKNRKIQEDEKKRSRQTKAKFSTDLKNNQIKIEQLQEEINQLYNQLVTQANNLELVYNDYNNLVSLLESKKTELRALRLNKPKRTNLTSAQEKKYSEYKNEYTKTEEFIKNCSEEISKVRQRFDVQNLKTDFEKRYAAELREIGILISSYKKRFFMVTENFETLFKKEQVTFLDSFKEETHKSFPNTPKTREDYEQAINIVLQVGEETRNQIEKRFSSFTNHVENLSFDIDDDYLVGWYKEQQEKLEEKLETTNELAQLGISVEIIDHELNVLYAQMANAIEYLKGYTDTHSEIKMQYNQLQTAFQHLEANFKMLKPLYHTTRRQRTEIKGEDILSGMRVFFASKLEQYDINLSANDEFLSYQFFTYESVITSVFINIINNALYWLIPVQSREIRIEYMKDTNEILILNNGEKIDERIIDDIFTLFFTRKKDGRGIGLYLARTSLRSVELDIIATNDKKYNKLGGACFIIRPYKKENV
ncbi:ATP-binding protein [Butyricimonas sp. Marseille-P3923]|uniref:ATP-binding protein n=1 Tax=Butyricimonas sp. Marseille-P3923 TaxID=1987504 RepID=UPI000C069141|nr:ATP-binding protein [Butyricimonas sp. Marseille-P3923]